VSDDEAPWRSITRGGYLLSAGPWRAFLYVLTSLPVAGLLCAGFGLLVLPWLAAGAKVTEGAPISGPLAILMLAGLVLLVVFGPLVAVPVGVLERGRLGVIDPRPVRSAHRPAPGDPVSWLITRYAEPATWRELLYAVFLGLVVPLGYGVFGFLVLIDLGLILSPLFPATGTDGWQFGTFTVNSTAEAFPLSIAGLLLAPVLGYALGLLAIGQGAAARSLLGDRDGAALREVAQSRARLVDAFENERRRIERDLHDGAQHRLTSLTLQLGMARLDVPDGSPAAAPLARAHDEAKELMVVLRDLIHGIRPQALTDLGLPAALRELAARSPLPVRVTVADEQSLAGSRAGAGRSDGTRPSGPVEGTAYFVASEALANVVKHAGATRADVLLARAGDTLVLEVRDDGRGGADPAAGTGLTGLADRVAAGGGRVLLASPAGGPTLVRVELPCRS
jgi:signal transduction histidine kinase